MTEPEKQILNDQIVAAIKNCYDPEIPVNIYELGLIYEINISDESNVAVKMTLTSPNCPAAQSLPAEVKHRTEEVDGVNSAEVEVVFEPPWTPQQMTESAKLVLNIL